MAIGPSIVLNASPQRNGTCATLARLLASSQRFDCACVQELDARDPQRFGVLDESSRMEESSHMFLQMTDFQIAGCRGCNACASTEGHRCIIDDDMERMLSLLEECSDLTIVSPVFFAGPPAQLKALLDRLQPHFWRNTRLQPKRPAQLYVVGQGGDPHGFEPLVTIVRSALAVAGFSLEAVHPCIGVSKGDLAAYLQQELQGGMLDD